MGSSSIGWLISPPSGLLAADGYGSAKLPTGFGARRNGRSSGFGRPVVGRIGGRHRRRPSIPATSPPSTARPGRSGRVPRAAGALILTTPPGRSSARARRSTSSTSQRVLALGVGSAATRAVHERLASPHRDLEERVLLGQGFPRAAKLRGEVLELREPVLHGQNSGLVVDVQLGGERKRRDRRRIDADHAPQRVARQQMTSAALAPLAVAQLVHVELADLLFTLDHPHRLRRPQSEGVDGASRPTPAWDAVIVAGSCRVACDDDLHGTAVAPPLIRLLFCAHSRTAFLSRPATGPCQPGARSLSL